jgi:hypothetical protein
VIGLNWEDKAVYDIFVHALVEVKILEVVVLPGTALEDDLVHLANLVEILVQFEFLLYLSTLRFLSLGSKCEERHGHFGEQSLGLLVLLVLLVVLQCLSDVGSKSVVDYVLNGLVIESPHVVMSVVHYL